MFFVLLAFPDPTDPTTIPDPVAIKVGSQAHISCPDQSGFLFNYYSIAWTNASTNATIAASDLQVLDQRFSIDQKTLDLWIDNVGLTNATELQCELRVKDPQNGNMMSSYPSHSIRLIVYSKDASTR